MMPPGLPPSLPVQHGHRGVGAPLSACLERCQHVPASASQRCHAQRGGTLASVWQHPGTYTHTLHGMARTHSRCYTLTLTLTCIHSPCYILTLTLTLILRILPHKGFSVCNSVANACTKILSRLSACVRCTETPA